jgi:hypothetical protein
VDANGSEIGKVTKPASDASRGVGTHLLLHLVLEVWAVGVVEYGCSCSYESPLLLLLGSNVSV